MSWNSISFVCFRQDVGKFWPKSCWEHNGRGIRLKSSSEAQTCRYLAWLATKSLEPTFNHSDISFWKILKLWHCGLWPKSPWETIAHLNEAWMPVSVAILQIKSTVDAEYRTIRQKWSALQDKSDCSFLWITLMVFQHEREPLMILHQLEATSDNFATRSN